MIAPKIWLLTGMRHGDNAQLRALAAELGWPAREVRLSHNLLHQVPNALLGARLLSLRERSEFRPPWPEMVLGIGRRAVPAARWIAARSDGRTRLVWLGRPRAALRHFALVLSTPQYAMPEAPNLIRLSLPWQAPMSEAAAGNSGAHVLAVLGGPSWSAAPTLATVDVLTDRAVERARAVGLPLVAATSPRTPPPLAARLRERLGPDARLYDWAAEGGRANPYRDWLAGAAEIVLSGDSISALAEAAWTDRPVAVVRVSPPAWLAAIDRCGGAAGRVWRRAGGNSGLAAPPPDLTAVRDALVARGLAYEEDGDVWRLAPCRAALEAERRAALARLRAVSRGGSAWPLPGSGPGR